ncbi:MAG: hypothetical protein HRU19_15210 [Pseudobacteriovorax sp.]|nr:hypothetical protein [Pseudobacteriovorax sp.]
MLSQKIMTRLKKYKYLYRHRKKLKNVDISQDDICNNNILLGNNVEIADSRLRGELEIGDYAKISNCRISASADSKVIVGRGVLIQGNGTTLSSRFTNIKVGDFSTLGLGCHLFESSHKMDTYTAQFLDKRLLRTTLSDNATTAGGIEIGPDCIIGLNSVIAGGTRLGAGCVVLPNSFVNQAFEPYGIIGGVPATRLGERFSKRKKIYLESLDWYNWPIEKIKEKLDLLSTPVSTKNRLN